jgi:hypothetical protein
MSFLSPKVPKAPPIRAVAPPPATPPAPTPPRSPSETTAATGTSWNQSRAFNPNFGVLLNRKPDTSRTRRTLLGG